MKGLAFGFYFAIALVLSVLMQVNILTIPMYIGGTIALMLAYMLTSAFLD